MADDTAKQRKKIGSLMHHLEGLEKELAPLLSQTLPETAVGLDTIQQAKLSVLVPYLVYDLIFIYLKMRGVDPKTHPVFAELDRVKEYFNKVKNVENPSQRTTAIDKAAASRFIAHAVRQATYGAEAADATPGAGPSTAMRADMHSLKTTGLAESSQPSPQREEDGEEETLRVIDEDENENENEDATAEREDSNASSSPSIKKGKKAAASGPGEGESAERKRRRQAADFFEDAPSPAARPSTELPKKKKKTSAAVDAATSSSRSTPQSTTSAETDVREKKSKKKKRRQTISE